MPEYEGYDSKQLARMTHLEPFFYPVWEMQSRETVKATTEPVFVLFDYGTKNPLTGDADTKQIVMYGYKT